MTFATHLKMTFASIALVSSFGMSPCSNVYAAPADDQMSTASAAQEFQVGSLYVEKYANPKAKGAPIILIPGLTSGGYVWDETVKRLRGEHELYVVTLAGFSGKPAIAGPKLPKLKASLLELIQTQKINKPVLVGHSLGSASSIWFATEYSNLIRGVFGVDGLPVFPGTENMSPEQRKTMAENTRTAMAGLDAATFASQQIQYMNFTGVLDPKLADSIGARAGKSDPAATADYMAELFMLDMRPDLHKISVPVAVVSPFYAPDFARFNMTEEQKNGLYKNLTNGIPNLKLISVNNSRHFVMQDQPEVFHQKLKDFLQDLTSRP